MGADRRDAQLDFLLEAVAVEGPEAFPEHVLADMRQVVRCDAVHYGEWTPAEPLEFSLAADDPEMILRIFPAYPQVRTDDPLAGGPGRCRVQSPMPDRAWLGRVLAISDFISDREFRSRGSTPRSASRGACGP